MAADRQRLAVSNSFTAGEIKLLRHVFVALPSIRGMSVIVRHDAYSSLARKIHTMDKKIQEMEAENRRAEKARAVENRLAERGDQDD